MADAARGSGLGRRLMHRAQDAMREAVVEFGYLGCRPAVVPFYEAAGWRRIHARERHEARRDSGRIVESADSPIMVCAALREVDDWPAGAIDLRGGVW